MAYHEMFRKKSYNFRDNKYFSICSHHTCNDLLIQMLIRTKLFCLHNDSSKISEKWMYVFKYSNWSNEHDNSNVCCQTVSTLWRNLSTSIKDMFKKCYTDPEIIFCKVNWTYVVFICNHFWECNTIDIA